MYALIKQQELYTNKSIFAHVRLPAMAAEGVEEGWTVTCTLPKYSAIYMRLWNPCTKEANETISIVDPVVLPMEVTKFVSHNEMEC